MTYSSSPETSAGHIVSNWTEQQLETLFRVYGDEPSAGIIARAITSWRGSGRRRRKLQSTLELRYVIEDALAAASVPAGGDARWEPPVVLDIPLTQMGSVRSSWKPREGENIGALAVTGVKRPTPAGAPPARKCVGYRSVDKLGTWPSAKAREKCLERVAQRRTSYPRQLARIFQALRIAANDELGHLVTLLCEAPLLLTQGGRFVALCYQPREDAALQAACDLLCRVCSSRAPTAGGLGLCDCSAGAAFRMVSPSDGVRADHDEVRRNRRSRSARMRVFERSCLLEDSPAQNEWRAALSRSLEETLQAILPSLQSLKIKPRRAESSAELPTPNASVDESSTAEALATADPAHMGSVLATPFSSRVKEGQIGPAQEFARNTRRIEPPSRAGTHYVRESSRDVPVRLSDSAQDKETLKSRQTSGTMLMEKSRTRIGSGQKIDEPPGMTRITFK